MILDHLPRPATPSFIKTLIQAPEVKFAPMSHIEVQSLAWAEMECTRRVVAGGVVAAFARPQQLTHLHASQSSRGVPIGSHVCTRKHRNTRIATRIAGTHAHIARCTQGPSARALVTPYKSIQSLRSRRAERPSGRRGPRRSGSHLQSRSNRCPGGTRSPRELHCCRAKAPTFT